MESKYEKVAYNNQYNAEKYDRYSLMLPKGTKEQYKAHAESRGEKLNSFIQRAIRETIERDMQEVTQ